MLYYIIESGTNKRVMIGDNMPLIIDETFPEEEIEKVGWIHRFYKTEKMPIDIYHQKFIGD